MVTTNELPSLGRDKVPEKSIDVRLRISALWIAMLFIFAYVDLFSLYRPDVRGDLANDTLAGFDITQTFLFSVTLFIVIPSLMVYLSLVLPRRVNRVMNVGVAALYVVACLGSAVDEWSYFVLGSVIEAILLGIIVHHSATWSDPLDAAPSV